MYLPQVYIVNNDQLPKIVIHIYFRKTAKLEIIQIGNIFNLFDILYIRKCY